MSSGENSASENNNNDEEEEVINIEDVPDIVLHPPSKVLRFVSSFVWKFFNFIGTKDGPDMEKRRVKCLHCNYVISFKSSTSQLQHHVIKKHKKLYDKVIEEEEKSKKPGANNLITNFTVKNASTTKKWKPSSQQHKTASKILAKWLCSSSRPIQLVEDEGFQELIEFLAPEFQVPSRKTITKVIAELYEEKKQETKDILSKVDYVSVTTDGGTSSNAVSFLDLNVHFIDENMELRSQTLGVRENAEEHTSENYRQHTDDILEEFNVQEKVVCYTTDNENKERLHKKSNKSVHVRIPIQSYI